MIFRLYHETRGEHVHCRLFAGPHDGALGKCGDLVMRVAEFESLVDACPMIDYFPRLPNGNSDGAKRRRWDGAWRVAGSRMPFTPAIYPVASIRARRSSAQPARLQAFSASSPTSTTASGKV